MSNVINHHGIGIVRNRSGFGIHGVPADHDQRHSNQSFKVDNGPILDNVRPGW